MKKTLLFAAMKVVYAAQAPLYRLYLRLAIAYLDTSPERLLKTNEALYQEGAISDHTYNRAKVFFEEAAK